MRKTAFLFVAMLVAGAVSFVNGGCSSGAQGGADTAQADSMPADTAPADTMEQIIAATPMPKAADELFDDFVFNFAANRRLQLARIKFPLPVYGPDGGKPQAMQRREWQMEHFFMHQDYYTLIFDNTAQMDLGKDTAVGHVVVEKIFLDEDRISQFVFDRQRGKWMMTQVRHRHIDDDSNASFLNFYRHFVADSAFQMHSVHNPLAFSGPDPDDDFGEPVVGTLAPDEWRTFAPELPRGMIFNILYGQRNGNTDHKIFVIRGIANGLETQLIFRRSEGRWKLVRLNT